MSQRPFPTYEAVSMRGKSTVSTEQVWRAELVLSKYMVSKHEVLVEWVAKRVTQIE